MQLHIVIVLTLTRVKMVSFRTYFVAVVDGALLKMPLRQNLFDVRSIDVKTFSSCIQTYSKSADRSRTSCCIGRDVPNSI